jgi:hypothetical protein
VAKLGENSELKIVGTQLLVIFCQSSSIFVKILFYVKALIKFCEFGAKVVDFFPKTVRSHWKGDTEG